MEYNENDMVTAQPVILKEKKEGGSKIWYIIIALLALGLIAWFGVTARWFGSQKKAMDVKDIISMESHKEEMVKTASIDSWQIQTKESFPIEKTLVLSGNLPDSCSYLGEVTQTRRGNSFSVMLPLMKDEQQVCTEALVPFEKAIELDILGLPAGVYTIDINGQQISFELEQDNALNFDVDTSK